MIADGGRPGDVRGFVHKRILGLVGTVAGVGAQFIPGPPGIAARAIVGGGRGGVSRASPRSIVNQRRGLPPGSRVQVPTPGIIGRIQRFLPGGNTGFDTLPGPFGLPQSDVQLRNPAVGNVIQAGSELLAGGGVCPPRGFHLNKSSYFLRDGTFVPERSRFVRNRKINSANGRSQDRAITRLERGQTQAKKLLKATGYRTISKQSSREMRNARKAVCK